MYDEDYLIHYGVKGMRWGVRKDRYKSADKDTRKKYREAYKKTDEYQDRIEKAKFNTTSIAGSVLGATIGGEVAHLLIGDAVIGRVAARSAGSLVGSTIAAYIYKAKKEKKKLNLKQPMNKIKEKGLVEYGENIIKGTPYDMLINN